MRSHILNTYMDAIVIMLLLQIKHWYADFWIQSYLQTVYKGVYGHPVGFSHTLEQTIGTLIALLIASYFFPISVALIIKLALLDMIVHYHVDWVKMKYGTKDNKTTRYWREFGLDQLAHQFTYILITYIVMKSMI
jgi:Protein of unknown function (DUF3307)